MIANRALLVWAAALLIVAPAVAAETWVWQIGTADRDTRELALGPGGYARFSADALFIVGRSDPARDWPYVHPGPADAWAGGRPHTFTVVFGLDTPPAGGGTLAVALADTHAHSPPHLLIRVNGRAFPRKMPAGAGDDSVFGRPEKGKPHRFEIALPDGLLKAGGNTVEIENAEGSWVLYDWIGLAAPGARAGAVRDFTRVTGAEPVLALVDRDGTIRQPVEIRLLHLGADAEAVVRAGGAVVGRQRLKAGTQTIEALLTPVEQERTVPLSVETGGRTLDVSVAIAPVRKMVVYILPHSHTDIGYTEIQTAIEAKQVDNLVAGIGHAKRTAGYVPGAPFVWNVEVLWAADLYFRRLPEAQRAELLEAIRKGWVGLNGMYLNALTGLCRPEELLRLFRGASILGGETGTPVRSAMISDVPGYTWGTVTAMAHAGIRYFSTAPNFFDRIGDILVQWENKPFWWVGPDGRSKVLVWIPLKGYAMSHVVKQLSTKWVGEYLAELEQKGYPYDIAHIRWSGHGDNAVPDPAICEFVKAWNAKYAYPKFVIATTDEAFAAFEKKYGDRLPEWRGEWSPYWEDGAGSSAAETALNRASAERLAQAETILAVKGAPYPAAAFEDAWNFVLLYSEHTWGAWCSVSEPERKETREQWEIKRGYALEADRRSRELLAQAAGGGAGGDAFDVYNTVSWPRTDLVVLSREQSAGGDRVTDDRGQPVPSQRLATGELAFLVQKIPPYAARRYTVGGGAAFPPDEPATAQGVEVANGFVRARLDAKTGAVAHIGLKGLDGNFVDTASGPGVNDYLYFVGENPADARRNGDVRIAVKERGPLVASLLVVSDAPGCNRLSREIRVVAGLDRVELINTVDKKRHGGDGVPAGFYKRREGKESLNFAFPFDVPDGVMRLEGPLSVFVPWRDLLPSACKNWFTVNRWVDVSNAERGITWATLDAPLVQVGGLTANLLESQANPAAWRKTVEPTQALYSWAMNNHWGTNYRAYQEGVVVFRYAVRPHEAFDAAEAARFGGGLAQPLVAVPASGPAPAGAPRVTISAPGVIATALKPSDDGKAWILRLYGASGKDERAIVAWGAPAPKTVHLSGTGEKPGAAVSGPVDVPAWGLVTLRAER